MDYVIDAKGKRLGRLASDIAVILQGKKSPRYDPRLPGKDRVLLKHFRDISLGGTKEKNKIYYRHTGYMGHLKEARYQDVFAKDPRRVVREAVRRMLPKNFLNQRRLNNLMFVDEAKSAAK